MSKVMSKAQQLQYGLWVVVWLVVNVGFWAWWLKPDHAGTWYLFVPMSIALFYEATLLPSFYLFFLSKMRRPVHKPAPRGLRVALITLCVPSSESIDVIEKQLKAMVNVDYPHDNWILDEGNDPEVKALAAKYGVNHFSRKGVAMYNQPNPPFKAKTKAGNVNAWIHAHGAAYDYFVQFDIDHLPRPDYLDMTLGHLATDPKVAWVQAPSVYGNYGESWAARGSSEQELVLQGPLQMGFYGFSQTPFIIGSHCTYRMSAINEIGGFQPTRAEDHLDTVELAARGYHGVFVPEAIAIGDGPESFDTYLAQQFAWAYSMIQVLFQHTPRLIKHYTPKQAVQFLFAQTWYTCWSTAMLVMFLMPVLALLTNQPITRNTVFNEAMMWYLPLPLTAYGIFRWSKPWQKPTGLNLSWRGILLHVARWPVVTWALINVLWGVQKPYMITPKGQKVGERPFNLGAHAPYFGLIFISLAGALWYNLWVGQSDTQGYLLFTLEGVLFMLLVFFVALITDIKEMWSVKPILEVMKMRRNPMLVLASLLFATVMTMGMSSQAIYAAVSWQPISPVSLPVNQVAVGAYDPNGELVGENLNVEHSFVVWYRTDQLESALKSAIAHRRVPMISLEPWPWNESGTDMGPSTLIQDTNAGLYDEYIRASARWIKWATPQQVIVRWGHEFELRGLYPWSTADAEAYKEAYRRVVDIFNEEGATNVLWMWAPAGNMPAVSYYPGSEYVDMIGVTILSDQVWERQGGFEDQRPFTTLFDEKYWLANTYGKPIWAAEVGVSSELQDFQVQWLSDARSSFAQYPQLQGFVYFNRINQHAPVNGHYPDFALDDQEWKEVFNN